MYSLNILIVTFSRTIILAITSDKKGHKRRIDTKKEPHALIGQCGWCGYCS